MQLNYIHEPAMKYLTWLLSFVARSSGKNLTTVLLFHNCLQIAFFTENVIVTGLKKITVFLLKLLSNILSF